MISVRDAALDILTIVAALCAVGLTATVAWERLTSSLGAPQRESRTIDNWREYGQAGHRSGSSAAKVTIVWWGDYQCPFCRRLAPAFKGVLEEFPDRVAVVYRHWPLAGHSAAYPAATAAVCADAQGGFQAFHDRLYQEVSWIMDPSQGLMTLAERTGLTDLEAFGDCIMDGTPDSTIAVDVAAIKSLGGTGTPTLLVDDVLLGSVPDSIGLVELVREHLGR